MATELNLPYDHVAAHAHLTAKDKRLARLIAKNGEFKFQLDTCDSVYESLLEAIVYQSISGKAAAKIYSRIKALGTEGCCPTPQQILATPIRALREAGLSGAKAAAMHDLAQKTLDGVVPTLEAAHSLTDEELVERLVSVRGIGAWTVEMFLIFRLGRPDVLPIHDYGVQKGFALTYKRPHPQAERTRRIRRTLAPLPQRRQLVHVARHRALRKEAQSHQSPHQKTRQEEIVEEARRNIAPN